MIWIAILGQLILTMSPTQMSGQRSPSSESVDDATATSAGSEIESKNNQPNQPRREKFPPKKIWSTTQF